MTTSTFGLCGCCVVPGAPSAVPTPSPTDYCAAATATEHQRCENNQGGICMTSSDDCPADSTWMGGGCGTGCGCCAGVSDDEYGSMRGASTTLVGLGCGTCALALLVAGAVVRRARQNNASEDRHADAQKQVGMIETIPPSLGEPPLV